MSEELDRGVLVLEFIDAQMLARSKIHEKRALEILYYLQTFSVPPATNTLSVQIALN